MFPPGVSPEPPGVLPPELPPPLGSSGGFGKSYNVNGRVFNKFENAIKYMKKLSENSKKSIKETTILLNKLNKAINEALEDELQVGDTVVLRGSQPLQLKRRGTIKKLNNETAVVEFPEVPEQDLMTREDTYYIDELEKV